MQLLVAVAVMVVGIAVVVVNGQIECTNIDYNAMTGMCDGVLYNISGLRPKAMDRSW